MKSKVNRKSRLNLALCNSLMFVANIETQSIASVTSENVTEAKK